MRLRSLGIKVVAWLANGLRSRRQRSAARPSWLGSARGAGSAPLEGVKSEVPIVRALVLGFVGKLPEDINRPPLSAELTDVSAAWSIHPAWGGALLGLIATTWLAYKRYQDMRRAPSASGDIYEAIFQAMPCPMFCKDARGEYVAVNRAYEEAFGEVQDASLDRDGEQAADAAEGSLPNEGGGFRSRDPRSAVADAQQSGREYRFRTATLERREDGAALVGILTDDDGEAGSSGPSQSGRYSEGLMDYALLSAINHDVRTPLTGILGALELLEYSELTTKQRELLRNAEGASKALQGILDDVLFLARLEAGATPREHQPFNPREVIVTALAALDDRADIEKVLDDRLAQRLLGDAACLRQVLTKLVTHAISRKLGKPWRFEVRVLAEGTRWQSVEFILELLRDKDPSEPVSPFAGDGCRADELAWIAACKLCEWMGFALQEQGCGWTAPRFVVRGCFARAADVLTDAPSPKNRDVPGFDLTSGLATILVAEDHELVREVIGRQLAALGWPCDLVSDGESALQALAQRDYALLITDRYMPKMDGLELVRRIRSAEGADRMPIVLLTANLPEDEGEAFSDIGIDEAICKPTSLQSLSDVLAKWIATRAEVGCKVDRVDIPNQTASDASQVVERLHVVFEGDVTSIDDYLRLLCNEQRRLKKHMGEPDVARIREVAHSLSGIGSFFGAECLAGLAMSVELGESAPDVIRKAEELGAYLEEFVVALRQRMHRSYY